MTSQKTAQKKKLFHEIQNSVSPVPPSIGDLAWRNLTRQVRLLLQSNPLYSLSLLGKTPHSLSIIPTDPWPGDPLHGHLILDGKIKINESIYDLNEFWTTKKAQKSDLLQLHAFDWIRDLRSVGDNVARRLTRQLILAWISRNQNWRSSTWSPEILGRRLTNWISLYDFFCSSADDTFREIFFKSLIRQARHLNRCWVDAPTSYQRLRALKGLIFASITLLEIRKQLPKLLEKLEEEIQEQILPDGGHISRLPSAQANLLWDLIDLRSLLRAMKHDIPKSLQEAIDKMAPIVRLFRHGDGGLSSFGGISPLTPNSVDMILSLADVGGKPPAKAPSMGYERCATKNSLLLINTGGPINSLRGSKANTLADPGTAILDFEWSVGRERLVVQGDLVLRSTEGTPLCLQSLVNQNDLKIHRKNQDGHILFDAHYHSQDFNHDRHLYFAAHRGDFRGEDTIELSTDGLLAIRFVLSPGIQVDLSPNGKTAVLKSPSGQIWRCLAEGHQEILCDQILDTNTHIIFLLSTLRSHLPQTFRWAFKSDHF